MCSCMAGMGMNLWDKRPLDMSLVNMVIVNISISRKQGTVPCEGLEQSERRAAGKIGREYRLQ
ncbi:MAG: hypothetical protein K8S18_03320 [Desulfobacula sp.]|nr:hypothetical protein [Desulfobacula sp.]